MQFLTLKVQSKVLQYSVLVVLLLVDFKLTLIIQMQVPSTLQVAQQVAQLSVQSSVLVYHY